MTIHENIKRIRQEKGMTQKKLGELCGINEANIRKYELGKANPKLETIRKISNGLGVYMNEVIGEQWGNFSPDEIKDDIENISTTPSREETTFLTHYRCLNSEGQQEAMKRIEELTEIEKYTKRS